MCKPLLCLDYHGKYEMDRKNMGNNNEAVGNVTDISGEVNLAGRDIFDEDDELFFPHERSVDDLVSRVMESRTVFIKGPSGSGKPSLV